MAHFQLIAWNLSDFDESFQAQFNSADNVVGIDVQLERDSTPIPLLVDDDVSGAEAVTLVEDTSCENQTFLAGSKIVVEQTFEISGSFSNKLFICRIGYEDLIVLSSVALEAGEKISIASNHMKTEPSFSSVNFARGTLIDTPHGALPIESLDDGDEVLTRDGGIQLIQRVALDRISGLELLLRPQLRPICIQAGALLGGLPGTDLIVAQQHRILLNDWRAAYFFGEEEILVPANSLLDRRNVTIECPETGIDFFQIGLAQPNLISANGLWAEACAREKYDIMPSEIVSKSENCLEEIHIKTVKTDSYAVHMPVLSPESQPCLAA